MSEPSPTVEQSSDEAEQSEVLSADAIEAAYREALQAVDDLDQTVEQIAGASDDEESAEAEQTADGEGPQEANSSNPLGQSNLSPRQVIEAVLFVGGGALTARKLASLIGEHASVQAIETAIDQLNRQYDAENRPYEIRLTEGGYCMLLREQYEKIRDRVYGIGPKEVKLSQEAVELLAFIAYRQPVTADDLTGTGRKNARTIARQLIRRHLVEEVAAEGDEPATFRTTDRFLELFGIGSVNELPYADDVDYK